jgi:2-keto-4-pentenoate hydratase/2-oxohepta-3-ene-1,7-dioic acid hydratase in catechol pathway
VKRAVLSFVAGVVALTTVAASAEAQNVQRFVRYQQGSAVSWGELVGATIHQLSDAPYLGGQRTGQAVAASSATLKAPVEPRQIFMTAFNFRSHITGEPAAYPGIFLVPPSSIIGSGENIIRPRDSQNLHYEAEAVAVVGREAANVPLDQAASYIFGVSAGNDVSERTWQAQDIQWTRAKGSRTFNAVGPHLVTGLDPANLAIEGRLNGERVQGENTSDMIYSLAYMLHYISQHFTLYPGDLIWTGTMGATRQMQPGDTYEVEIPGIGILRNPLVQGN